MEAIVAVFSDWGIGSEGTQQVVLKADRAHFRELTKDAAVIVGHRTLADFPGGRPLKGRNNIVVTRQNIGIEGAEVAHSTEEALALAAKYPRTLVIGGAEDQIVTGNASAEIAERIPGAQLYMYEGLGHGLYEEAPDFLARVREFCRD